MQTDTEVQSDAARVNRGAMVAVAGRARESFRPSRGQLPKRHRMSEPPSFNRRRFCGVAAATVAAGQL